MCFQKCIKKILNELKAEIDGLVIIKDFKTPLLLMDRTSRQKINKETQDSNNTIDQMDLPGI